MPYRKTEFTSLCQRRRKIKACIQHREMDNIVCRMYCIVCSLQRLYIEQLVLKVVCWYTEGLVHCVESLNSLIRDWAVLPISVDSPRQDEEEESGDENYTGCKSKMITRVEIISIYKNCLFDKQICHNSYIQTLKDMFQKGYHEKSCLNKLKVNFKDIFKK